MAINIKRGKVGSKALTKAIAAAIEEAVEEAVEEGAITPGAAVPNSVEATAPTTAEFNALLASLRTAGVIAE